MARKARTWKGARTPQALKRDRQALRRRAVNRRARSEAKTLVQRATNIATGREEGNGSEAVMAAVSALDKAASKGIIHPNNAARRKSRLMSKANVAHLLDEAAVATETAAPKRKSTATKTAQRKKVAAAKASKVAAAKASDRPRTAAGKAKVAVTRAKRDSAAARRRAKSEDEKPAEE